MYFRESHYRLLAKILLFVFFVEPVVFSLSVRPVRAQTPASSTFTNAFGTYDGISQWGNLDIVNNPAIGTALKSCLRVVPSFVKKIKKVYATDKSSAEDLNTIRGVNKTNICLPRPEAKWILGNERAIDDGMNGYFTADDLKACEDQSDINSGLANSQKFFGSVDSDTVTVQDREAHARLDEVLSEQHEISHAIEENKKEAKKTNATLEEVKIREECMDSIAYSMTKTLLAGVTEGTVNLINTGNFGDPFFIKDSQKYFDDLSKTSLHDVFGGLITELENRNKNNQDYPFFKETFKNLVAQKVPAPFQERTKYTLEQILSGDPYNKENDPGVYSDPRASGRGSLSNAFRENFSVGGWSGWLGLTQQPQNNAIGFGILAQEYLDKSEAEKKENAKSELEQSGGFLSQRKCVAMNNPKSTTGDGKPYITRGIKIGPDDKDCRKTEVVTPGSVLASRLDAVITSDVHQLELADKFNESLSLIFSAAFNRLTSEGLSAISSKTYGSWADQTRKQSFIERYNSTLVQGQGSTGGSNIGTAELIYRRTTSSYSSGDFDITTDMFDQQVGCQIRPGILTTEKNYLLELKRSSNPTLSPIYKLMPAMAELDFCVPGPTTNWEEMADEKYSHLIEQISENGIVFISDPTVPGSFYGEVGKQIGDIEKKRANKELAVNATAGGLNAAGAILLVVPDPSGITKIVGASLIAAAFVVNIVHKLASKKKIREEQALVALLNDAPGAIGNAMENAFIQEAGEWGLEQINYLKQDYIDYKKAIYDKFSDANSIPVAAVARPFIKDLPSYAQNTYDIQQSYVEELKVEEQIVDELQDIFNDVKKIKDAATARVRAEEKRQGLPVGALTSVPDACKPQVNQCPASKGPASPYLLSQNSTLTYGPVNTGGVQTLVDPGGVAGVTFPDPKTTFTLTGVPNINRGNGYNVTVNIQSNPAALSLILSGPFWGTSSNGYGEEDEEEVYGKSIVNYPAGSITNVIPGTKLENKNVTLVATNANGKKSTYSCTIKKLSGGNLTCE